MPVTRERTRPLGEEEALGLLAGWTGAPAGALYSRADGRLLLAARGVLRFNGTLLEIHGDDASLRVWIPGGDYGFGPISRPTPQRTLERGDPGLHVYSLLGDWLCVSPSLEPRLEAAKLTL
jgi:hypothetical protein